MALANDVAREWYGNGVYLYELEWCKNHIRPGVTVVDCGAHHGLMAMCFARWTGGAGRVISYEPIPENVETLRENLRLNAIDNVDVRPVGLGASNDRRRMAVSGGNGMVAPGGEIEVSIVRLDDDLPQATRVDFLKIDVEGSDLEMLIGAQRIIDQLPLIDLELHNFAFADRSGTLEWIFGLLSARKWRFEVLPSINDSVPVVVDGPVNLAWLAQFDNPHVFCTPRS